MADKKITVRIAAKDTASRKLQKVGREVKKTSLAFKAAAVAATAFAVALTAKRLATIAKSIFDIGASVGEVESKFATVFGGATRQVSDFIDTFATMAGLTEREAKNTIATLGAIGQGMGLATDESADFAESVTRLAGDLASFNEVPIADTLRDIQSGLAGQVEPLRKYGIELDMASVNEVALANNIGLTAKQLTNEHKLLARLELAYKRAGVQTGDLIRTQDSLANRAKQTRAAWLDLIDVVSVNILALVDTQISGGLGRITTALKTFAQAVETDIGAAFFALGKFLGAKLMEGFASSVAALGSAMDLRSHIPIIGEYLENLNLIVKGWEAIAGAASASADAALENMGILSRAGRFVAGGAGSTVPGADRIDIPGAPTRRAISVDAPGFRGSKPATPWDRADITANLDKRMRELAPDLTIKPPDVEAPDMDQWFADLGNMWDTGSKEWSENAKETMFIIGGELIGGLIKGTIKPADLARAAMGIASMFFPPLKLFMGIFSPSKITYGYGQNIVQGMIGGIDSLAGTVKASALSLADSVTSAFTLPDTPQPDPIQLQVLPPDIPALEVPRPDPIQLQVLPPDIPVLEAPQMEPLQMQVLPPDIPALEMPQMEPLQLQVLPPDVTLLDSALSTVRSTADALAEAFSLPQLGGMGGVVGKPAQLTAKLQTDDTSSYPPWALDWLASANIQLRYAGEGV